MMTKRRGRVAIPVIRHAEPSDADAVALIFSGPRAVRGTLQIPFASTRTWRRRLEEPERGWVGLLACLEGEAVGMLGLHTNPDQPRLRHTGYLGMCVRDDWQGRGIGSALLRAGLDIADQWMGLVRVTLTVFADNEPAVRLYRRFGFEVEGVARQGALRDGVYEDTLMMARLRPPGGRSSGVSATS